MAKLKKINPFSRINDNTGFGVNPNGYGGRFINRDGSFNLRREGKPFWDRFNIYQVMLSMPLMKFILTILIFFISINLIFTGLYFSVGAEQLQGVIGQSFWQKFKEIYFFSTETFTTVGYGRVNPVGDGANVIAALEAMCGFLSFAIATGLIYGRFSRPVAHVVFSDNALIGPYRNGKGLMFRFAGYKERHALTDVEVQVNLALLENEDGKLVYKFYDLPLERKRIENLPMNWTVVHQIDENSPLLGLTEEDMKNSDVEIYVLIRGFDDVYANLVIKRTSYTYDEIKLNRKFVPMYRESENGRTTILELHKLNTSIPVTEGEKGDQPVLTQVERTYVP
jgi:inward rectifier potassium channel